MSRSQYQLGSYYNTTEQSLLLVPPGWTRSQSKRLIIFVHGAASDCKSAGSGTGGFKYLIPACDQLGFPVLSIDAGGNNAQAITNTLTGGADDWGNSVAVAAIDAAVTWATTASTKPAGYQQLDGVPGGLGPPILWGVSMGGAAVLNYAARNTAKVKAIVTMAPITDINDVQVNNRSSLAAGITAAYGGNWATNGQAASPSWNPSLNIPVGLQAINHQLWYSTGDAVSMPATNTSYITAYGAHCTGQIVPGAPSHGGTGNAISSDPASMATLLAFLSANA